MTIRDRDGEEIPVQRIEPRGETGLVLERLLYIRNDIADLIEELKALDLLGRRCPALEELEEWRAATADRIETVGISLLALITLYTGETISVTRAPADGGEGEGAGTARGDRCSG